jgi:hypothetical protein
MLPVPVSSGELALLLRGTRIVSQAWIPDIAGLSLPEKEKNGILASP